MALLGHFGSAEIFRVNGRVAVHFKYEIGQRIFIIRNDYCPGVVRGIHLFGSNLFYIVEYWVSGERKTDHFYEDELSESTDEKRIGVGA
jgi:hypothetical protein